MSSWNPIKGQIMTRWVKDVNPESPFPDYPRPQLERKEWLNLNGQWDYAIRPKNQNMVSSFDGKILVPYPVESALSGVKRKVGPKQKLWYRCNFKIQKSWKGQRLLLHFGAVEWETTVWVNGSEVGSHRGGYTPFSFDISENIQENNEIKVAVWDPTNKGGQNRGKQTLRPFGVFYTAITGIWQTVWLEPVPETYLESLKIIPDIDKSVLKVEANVHNLGKSDIISVKVKDGEKEIKEATGDAMKPLSVSMPSVKLWSPENPFLYDLEIILKREAKILDHVSSYVGMRKIALGVGENGNKTIELNNKSVFQYGTLDQGYWPDGLYTAPTDEALRYDIEITKKLGFNMIRKHVKIEPARWYYYCDKIGVLVWQDLPNAGKTGLVNLLINMMKSQERFEGKRKDYEKIDFYNELEEMISSLYNHPSIVVWVPFNEGWGQFETEKVVEKTRELDSTRLINNASGWHDKGVGDICDCHHYPSPKFPENVRNRAPVCGEFGGLGLKVEDHMWKKMFKWSYKKSPDALELTEKYAELIKKLKELKNLGLTAAVYTQTTDVEGEVNGLLTYDREIIKIGIENIKKFNSSLFNP